MNWVILTIIYYSINALLRWHMYKTRHFVHMSGLLILKFRRFWPSVPISLPWNNAKKQRFGQLADLRFSSLSVSGKFPLFGLDQPLAGFLSPKPLCFVPLGFSPRHLVDDQRIESAQGNQQEQLGISEIGYTGQNKILHRTLSNIGRQR